jgi:hypothetical protein
MLTLDPDDPSIRHECETLTGQESVWEKSGVCRTPSAPDLLEARLCIVSGLPTTHPLTRSSSF